MDVHALTLSMKWRDNLGWLIKFDDRALKSLSKLDRQTAKRITIFLRERVSVLETRARSEEAYRAKTWARTGNTG